MRRGSQNWAKNNGIPRRVAAGIKSAAWIVPAKESDLSDLQPFSHHRPRLDQRAFEFGNYFGSKMVYLNLDQSAAPLPKLEELRFELPVRRELPWAFPTIRFTFTFRISFLERTA